MRGCGMRQVSHIYPTIYRLLAPRRLVTRNLTGNMQLPRVYSRYLSLRRCYSTAKHQMSTPLIPECIIQKLRPTKKAWPRIVMHSSNHGGFEYILVWCPSRMDMGYQRPNYSEMWCFGKNPTTPFLRLYEEELQRQRQALTSGLISGLDISITWCQEEI